MVGRFIQWREVMECTQRWMDVSMESENKMNVGQKGWKSERWEYAGDFLPPQLPGPCYHFSALPKWFCLYTRQGDSERDAEVRLMKRMSFKVLGKSKGSGVVGCHQNFTNSENFLHKRHETSYKFLTCSSKMLLLGSWRILDSPHSSSSELSPQSSTRLQTWSARRQTRWFLQRKGLVGGQGCFAAVRKTRKLMNTSDKKQLM